MVHDAYESKRPYQAPSFEVIDINVAKAQLETNASSMDPGAQKMLSLIEVQLEERNPAR
jgi:hypothetical protein